MGVSNASCDMDDGSDSGCAKWDIGDPAAGEGRTVYPYVTANSGTELAAIVTADANEAAPLEREVHTVVEADPPLTLVMAEDPDPVASGNPLTYTIVYGNRGTGLTQTLLRATLPPGTTFAAASDNGALDTDTGIITWDLHTLVANSTGRRSFTVTVDDDLGAAEPGFHETRATLEGGTTPQQSAAPRPSP